MIIRPPSASCLALVAAVVEYDGATKANPVPLGNVNLWRDGNELVYSVPSMQWDRQSVSAAIATRMGEILRGGVQC